MKASFKFILAALAATAALAACTKETTPPSFEKDKVNPAAEGSRVIAVSFGQQTKTYLDDDGLQPKFSPNDSILISNGKALDTCAVDVNGDKATITTKLTGPLRAVYPYTAAGLNGNTIDTVLVSTVQSGEFADANICMAKMKGENDESLSFDNKTAVFRITPKAEDISYLEVSAEGFNIANNVLDESTYTDLNKVRVEVPATNKPDEYFVSILVPDDLKVSHLKFSDGTNVKTITGERAAEAIAIGTIYNVTVELNTFTITREETDITGASFKVMKGSEAVAKASPGEELKVDITCPNGYIVGGITVFKTDDYSIQVEVEPDGSFTMPEYAVTVKVEFELDESGGGTEMEHGGLLG